MARPTLDGTAKRDVRHKPTKSPKSRKGNATRSKSGR